MKVDKVGTIDWSKALVSLSMGEFFLLNVMYRLDMDMNDIALIAATNSGSSTYRKRKRVLVNKGYLTVDQVGRGVYKYTLKDITND